MLQKKIRNNIYSSGPKGSRLLILPSGKEIKWSYWIRAYEWDRTNPLQIHQKLTSKHLYLTPTSKMTNGLAEEALNKDMLQLMLEFRISEGVNGTHLDGVIELLHQTSEIIEIFRDSRPLTSDTDPRLSKLRKAHKWFLDWEAAVMSESELTVPEKNHRLITDKTRYDIASCIIGFEELCQMRHAHAPGSSIVPSRLNSDVLENIFSQQRGIHNGTNTNPDYVTYKQTVNSIILNNKESVNQDSRKYVCI